MCLSDLGDAAGNLFAVGEYLSHLTLLGQETGCTILIVHHCRKGTNTTFTPAELSDIQWSGFAEWVRQWVLLSRRSPFEADGDGHHELWMNVGGSAGNSGLWAVDINEGRADSDEGRRWEVAIDGASKARATAAADAREKRDQEKANAQSETARREVEKLADAIRRYPDGETSHTLRDAAGLNGARFKDALATLLTNKRAIPVEVTKGYRKAPYEGYKLAYFEPMGQRDNGDGTPCLTDGTTSGGTSAPIGGTVPSVVGAIQMTVVFRNSQETVELMGRSANRL